MTPKFHHSSTFFYIRKVRTQGRGSLEKVCMRTRGNGGLIFDILVRTFYVNDPYEALSLTKFVTRRENIITTAKGEKSGWKCFRGLLLPGFPKTDHINVETRLFQ